ncbi:Translation initiation factor eIF-2B subunit delta [Thelohanellus kitauei]|uniref:Translation initiation factor eIF2B subunit delta n=1 Tax=Thelohanellus kitauei TaxID=669202 RepID=A0A0C2MMZ9_THEKT|nr:Translation initiation factor eIF-2B subunit delta [Thelohanellus kitauei]
MATIIKLLKEKFSETHAMTESDMKKRLNSFLNEFLNERIFLAGDIIGDYVYKTISDGDVILTCTSYESTNFRSKIILGGFLKAYQARKSFKVVIVDFPPRKEGLEMLRQLSRVGIDCVYICMNGLSLILPTITKILIPACSLLLNGAVLAAVGSAVVAILGYYYHIPVLVCCETYNFTERAQTNAIVYNELGDPDDIIDPHGPNVQSIQNWKENSRITLVNPYYDVIQAEYVTAVLTEMGVIPSSSAPIILRVKN